jgi:hypothetical protein
MYVLIIVTSLQLFAEPGITTYFTPRYFTNQKHCEVQRKKQETLLNLGGIHIEECLCKKIIAEDIK